MRNPSSSSSGTSKTPCCSKVGIKRGPWTPEEDEILANYIKREGEGRWRTLPKHAGLLRCGKSCRLRWMNYLRPSVKRGRIAPDEEDLILRLHRLLGNRWSLIAGRIPGRTDNEIKNYWNTHLSKKLISQGIDPRTHKPLNPNPNPAQIVHDRAPISTQGQNPDSLGLQETAGNAIQSGTKLEHNLVVNEEDYVENCDEDNMFSSFLDSLINDNMFVTQQQQPNFHPSPAQTFNHATIWETELIRSTINASSDDQQSALNNHRRICRSASLYKMVSVSSSQSEVGNHNTILFVEKGFLA